MKKILRTILITALVFSPLVAKANVLSADEVKSMVTKQVCENYRKYTDAELNVQVVALPFKDIDLPDGKVTIVLKQSMDKFMPRDLETVLIYVNDKYVKTFTAPIVVKAYKDVLVATCPIPRERVINREVVKTERKEVSNTLDFHVTPDMLNKEIMAKKYFVAGEVIDKRFVKLRPDILRNSNVTVYFATNNLSVSIEAIALSDGVIGENICLMNKSYNKVYNGRVIGENKVLVEL